MRKLAAIYLLICMALFASWQCLATQVTLTGAGKPSGGGGGGTVVFDAVGSGSVTNSASGVNLTWTHTPVGAPTAVAVGIQSYIVNCALTTGQVTYGAVSLTLLASSSVNNGTVVTYIFGAGGATTLPTGAQTVTVNLAAANPSGTCYINGGSITVTGGATTGTGFETATTNFGTGTTTTSSPTSATGELVVDIVGNSGPDVTSAGGTQTVRWGAPGTPNHAGGDAASGSTASATAGSTTMTWTYPSSTSWITSAVAFHN